MGQREQVADSRIKSRGAGRSLCQGLNACTIIILTRRIFCASPLWACPWVALLVSFFFESYLFPQRFQPNTPCTCRQFGVFPITDREKKHHTNLELQKDGTKHQIIARDIYQHSVSFAKLNAWWYFYMLFTLFCWLWLLAGVDLLWEKNTVGCCWFGAREKYYRVTR